MSYPAPVTKGVRRPHIADTAKNLVAPFFETDAMRRAVMAWLALMAFVVVSKLLLTLFPGMFPLTVKAESQAAILTWPAIGIEIVLGTVAASLAIRVGLPEPWVDARTNIRRVAVAVGLGLGFAGVAVLSDVQTGWTKLIAASIGQANINVQFPTSLLFYPSGAIIVELVYRILPIAVILWLVSDVLLKGRGRAWIFWIMAALTSCIEPLNALPVLTGGLPLFGLVFAIQYSSNMTEAALFRRYGFVAMVVMRVAFYMVWHIGYAH